MNTRLKREHRVKVLCAECSLPAKYPFGKCDKHLKGHRMALKRSSPKIKQHRRDNGLCITCGLPLFLGEEGIDVGHVTCINCSLKIKTRRTYASI
jgi:hypothetical protein